MTFLCHFHELLLALLHLAKLPFQGLVFFMEAVLNLVSITGCAAHLAFHKIFILAVLRVVRTIFDGRHSADKATAAAITSG